jgi:hypothetical protein
VREPCRPLHGGSSDRKSSFNAQRHQPEISLLDLLGAARKTAQVTALQVPTFRPTPIRTVQSPPFSTTNGCKISANHGRENTDEEHEAMWQAGSDESRSTLGAGADCEVWIKVVWQFSNKCAIDFSPFSRRTVRFPESNRDDSRPPFCAGRNV